ncbi:hypothetical protein ACQ4M3_04230 [Leptolyngbya sp. AN03gr2]|uniref:hypothetical protein n=1 Tax=unclassified Leptolyngbya TaxID=2650499 RepID=UPI003D314787
MISRWFDLLIRSILQSWVSSSVKLLELRQQRSNFLRYAAQFVRIDLMKRVIRFSEITLVSFSVVTVMTAWTIGAISPKRSGWLVS